MRVFLCLALFLTACARSAPELKARDPILPPEEFKVYPGLLGLPAPPEPDAAADLSGNAEAPEDAVSASDEADVPDVPASPAENRDAPRPETESRP